MRIYQVDAFSAEPFQGNPAAVCLLEGEWPEKWMQSVAAEMNLAETAFVAPSDGGLQLRWFTPTVEVDLCGHATLASAHVLWEQGEADSHLAFSTRSGILTAERDGDGIRLDFPADPVTPITPPAGLDRAIGAPSVATGRGASFLLVEVADEATVRQLTPDIGAIAAIDANGVIVTAPGQEVDFVSRFFAPRLGINEDQVTGAAHCTLAPYWGARLGRVRLRGYQASARGGHVDVEVAGDRVLLRGRAVTVLRGELLA